MMLVNLSAILGVPNLGIARVPLKILNSHKYQGRKWVAVPTARVQTKNNLAGFPISPPEMNSIDVQPAYTRYAHSQALQKPTSSSSANVNVSNIHATKTSTQSYTTNQPANAQNRPQDLQSHQHMSTGHSGRLPQGYNRLPPMPFVRLPTPGSIHDGHLLNALSHPVPASVLPPKKFHTPRPALQAAASPSANQTSPLPAKVPRSPTPWAPVAKPISSNDFMHMPTLTAQPGETSLAQPPSAINSAVTSVPPIMADGAPPRSGMSARKILRAAADAADPRKLYYSYFG
ncbi:hypothetical protein BIW11_12915 [Tropilaelaps mercedesae]|uniref:Uncharacterized protein n=1 Tax=Tropilaelaps mercedesae TaxID=418985 RepID=A0A1V9X4M3_9ACAR|nr:hypothetical protein BIW11_12915 [Tropilaelaps mercedesae]